MKRAGTAGDGGPYPVGPLRMTGSQRAPARRRVGVDGGIVIIMTEKPRLVNQVLDWIAKARSFHHRQLPKHRKVVRVGSTRFTLTKGHAAVATGGFFASGSVSSAGAPDLIFWAVLLGGWFGGWFLFPVPDSSIASKRGPADVTVKNPAELDTMTPEQIQAYENNMVLKHRIKDPKLLGAGEALGRQRERSG